MNDAFKEYDWILSEQAREIQEKIDKENTQPIFEIEGLKIKTHSKTHFLLENEEGKLVIVPVKDLEQTLQELFVYYELNPDGNDRI